MRTAQFAPLAATNAVPTNAVLQLTVGATAKTLRELIRAAVSDNNYNPPKGDTWIIQVEAGNIRYCGMGIDPTATKGKLMIEGSEKEFDGDDIDKIKFISTGDVTPTLINYEIGDKINH